MRDIDIVKGIFPLKAYFCFREQQIEGHGFILSHLQHSLVLLPLCLETN